LRLGWLLGIGTWGGLAGAGGCGAGHGGRIVCGFTHNILFLFVAS